jgi:hypothetical protein
VWCCPQTQRLVKEILYFVVLSTEKKRKARSVSGKRRLSGPNPPEIAVRCDGCGLRSRPVRDAPPLQFHSRVDHTRPSSPVSRTRGLVCGEACMLFAFPKRCLTTPPNPATKINSHKPTEPAVRWAAIHAGEHCSQPQNEKPPVSTHPPSGRQRASGFAQTMESSLLQLLERVRAGGLWHNKVIKLHVCSPPRERLQLAITAPQMLMVMRRHAYGLIYVARGDLSWPKPYRFACLSLAWNAEIHGPARHSRSPDL